ncbi:MAG: ABC transporter substrate-binding protein [Acidimicrobiales bacterium]
MRIRISITQGRRSGGEQRRRAADIALAVALGPGLALGLTACSGSPPPPPSTSPYLVGATVDESGPLAAYGHGFAQAWMGYFDRLNAHGGIHGHPVRLEILDSASNPVKQLADMHTLLAAKVLAVSGITVSDTCLLLAPSMSRAHVPELCTTIPATLALAPPPYVYAMSDPETMWVKAVSQIVATEVHMAAPRVATILPDVAGLHDMGAAFDADAASRNWTVVANQTVPLAQLSDVGAQVQAVLAARPDAVVTDIASVGAIPMVQQLRAGGFTGPIVMGNSDYPTLAALKDPELFQIWATQVVDPSSAEPGVREMVEALGAQGVSGVSALNALDIPVEYMGASLLAKALAGCPGVCSARELDQVLASTVLDVAGLTVGSYGFSPGRNVPVDAVDVYHWDPSADAPRLWASNLPAVQPFPTSP